VVFGAGTQPATFHLDNLVLKGVRPDRTTRTALHLDFEEGPNAVQKRTTLLRAIAEAVKGYTPPPVEVDAPDYVRMGAFVSEDGRLLVHLHNRHGRRADWLGDDGPDVALELRGAIATARSALTGERLQISRARGRNAIVVPAVALYEVVEVRSP
jgi:hypothetical protein